MTRIMYRLWFWLTTSRRCMTCKTILHRRWLWLPKQRLECGAVIPRVTDGFCPKCFESFVQPYTKGHL
jgi:hypothetical protein